MIPTLDIWKENESPRVVGILEPGTKADADWLLQELNTQ
jgi:hypothetical protein